MSKKVLTIVLAICMLLALVACGSKDTKSTEKAESGKTTDSTKVETGKSEAPQSSEAPQKSEEGKTETSKEAGKALLGDKDPKDVKIALSIKTLGNPMFMHLKEVIEKALGEHNYSVDTFDAQNDAQKEFNNVSDIIAAKYDVLLITCMDYEASAVVVDQALEAGMVVGVLDSGVKNMDSATFCCMSDNVEAGKLAMEGLAKHINGKGKIVVYENELSFATRQRSEGRDAVLKNYPDIQIVNRVNAPLAIDTGMNMMDNFLQADPDIVGGWTGNDLGAQGFIAALKTAGKQPGDVGIVAIDGNLDSIELIKEGWQTGTSAQYFGKLGRTSIDTLIKIFKGEDFGNQLVLVPVEWIDKSNVDSFEAD